MEERESYFSGGRFLFQKGHLEIENRIRNDCLRHGHRGSCVPNDQRVISRGWLLPRRSQSVVTGLSADALRLENK